MRSAAGAFALGVAFVLLSGSSPADAAWVEARSPHFAVLSDADPRIAAEVVRRLEAFRSIFAALAPAVELSAPVPTRAFAFRDGQSFAPYRVGGDDRVVGQFVARHEVSFLLFEARPDRLGVVYHEYTHELVRHNLPGVPLWFNEGLAEYYRSFRFADGRAVVGEPIPEHLRRVAAQGLDLEGLLSTEPTDDFHTDDPRAAFYASAWALVHFFLSESGGSERLLALLEALAEGESPERATEQAVGLDLRELETVVWRHHLEGDLVSRAIDLGPSPPVSVSVVDEGVAWARLGEMLAWTDRSAAAERHLDWALSEAPSEPAVLSALGVVRTIGGFREDALLHFGDAVAAGARDPVMYLVYGRSLLAEGRGKEAYAAFERALALEPGYAEARALFGLAHLAAGRSPQEGVLHLEAALEQLPERFDLARALVEVQVAAGELEAAEATIVLELEPEAPEALVAAAREEVAVGRALAAAEEAWKGGRADEALEWLGEAIARSSDRARREALERRRETLEQKLLPTTGIGAGEGPGGGR